MKNSTTNLTTFLRRELAQQFFSGKKFSLLIALFIATTSIVCAQDFWLQKADAGSSPRALAVGFSIGDKGYIGTGSPFDNTYLDDFWEYDPATDTWTQKADFAGGARMGAVG